MLVLSLTLGSGRAGVYTFKYGDTSWRHFIFLLYGLSFSLRAFRIKDTFPLFVLFYDGEKKV